MCYMTNERVQTANAAGFVRDKCCHGAPSMELLMERPQVGWETLEGSLSDSAKRAAWLQNCPKMILRIG